MLDVVSVEGVDSAPNRAIVRASDELQTLRHTVDRAGFDDCAMSDGQADHSAATTLSAARSSPVIRLEATRIAFNFPHRWSWYSYR